MGSRPGADRQAIDDVLAEVTRAWDAADADAYGRCFTADASYVTFVGTAYQGRADITESRSALFRAFTKGTRMASETLRVTFLCPHAAVVVGRGDTFKRRRPAGSAPQTGSGR
ncbi:SgcJ/EcaC family oxidoreductase [Amorphoplanes digitatis]|uniref:Uncharacterized protein (TIGR02246 family) n=1 Tax=Actinoplanes digitatis TaxID=1868 RepID=A0A7W7I3P0_9ACTN|nr:SgcJ/EcaC family oxidoreductase [Actinoplanes digitatis]MBB4765806.1 uncharacterized protein (TIGR02246 family) [Actinoplanes digitatis]GID93402.1 hypothetical protein Adi01nite_28140 [Actinoplanes digitatis]